MAISMTGNAYRARGLLILIARIFDNDPLKRMSPRPLERDDEDLFRRGGWIYRVLYMSEKQD